MTPPASRATLGPDTVPLPDASLTGASLPDAPDDPTAGCPSCGEAAEPADRFCEACGATLPVPDEPVPAPGPAGPAARTDLRAVVARPRECPTCGPGTSDDGWCSDCGRPVPVGRDHVEETVPDGAAITDRGLVRPRNEDAYALARVPAAAGSGSGDVVLAVVCDGVASVPGGDEASLTACEAALEAGLLAVADGDAAEEVATASAVAARAAVDALAGTTPVAVATGPSTSRVAGRRSPTVPADPPACTYVAAVVTGDEVVVSWVGDSRAYWLDTSPGAVPGASHSCLLSTDDSWAAEVVAAGLLDPEAAWADRRAHVITRWLAADAPEHPAHQLVLRPDASGVLLLCSDGLWNHVPDADALAALLEHDGGGGADGGDGDGGVDLTRSARALVRAALDDGGYDNTTLVLVPVTVGSGGSVGNGGTW